MSRAKNELFVIHTDKDGNETRHKIKVTEGGMKGDVKDCVWWAQRAIETKEYNDYQDQNSDCR